MTWSREPYLWVLKGLYEWYYFVPGHTQESWVPLLFSIGSSSTKDVNTISKWRVFSPAWLRKHFSEIPPVQHHIYSLLGQPHASYFSYVILTPFSIVSWGFSPASMKNFSRFWEPGFTIAYEGKGEIWTYEQMHRKFLAQWLVPSGFSMKVDYYYHYITQLLLLLSSALPQGDRQTLYFSVHSPSMT